MNLVDAAAFHQLVLEHEAQPSATLLRQQLAFLRFLARQGIAPTAAALSVENVQIAAAATGAGAELRLAMWQWAEFLVREGVIESNPLEEARP